MSAFAEPRSQVSNTVGEPVDLPALKSVTVMDLAAVSSQLGETREPAGLPDTLTGKRDKALLALGFAGAFRRSELVALDVEDLREDPEGLRVRVRRSKVDQEGAGFEKAIPHGRFIRPVVLVRDWLEAAGIKEGVRCSGRYPDPGGCGQSPIWQLLLASPPKPSLPS